MDSMFLLPRGPIVKEDQYSPTLTLVEEYGLLPVDKNSDL